MLALFSPLAASAAEFSCPATRGAVEAMAVPAGEDSCDNCISRSLMITDPAILLENNSPARREWTFEHLMTQMAGSHDPRGLVADWLRSFENDQVVNNISIPARKTIRQVVIDPWKERLGLRKDISTDPDWITHEKFFAEAPFKLTAIVNRIDLAKFDRAPPNPERPRDQPPFTNVRNAGEGRFIFQLMGGDKPAPGPDPKAFTIILEYELSANSPEQLLRWARDWRELARHTDVGVYRVLLANLTRRFTDRDAVINRPNNVSLNQLRTNEIELDLARVEGGGQQFEPRWELREFRLDANGALRNSTVALTPNLSFDQGSLRNRLADFVKILEGVPLQDLERFQISNGKTFEVPLHLDGMSFRTGHAIVPNDWPKVNKASDQPGRRPRPLETWLLDRGNVFGGVLPQDRRWFSFNTCNGCHSGDTATVFTQVDLRGAGRLPPNATDFPEVPDSILSRFLCEFDLPARRLGLVGFLRAEERPSNLTDMLNAAVISLTQDAKPEVEAEPSVGAPGQQGDAQSAPAGVGAAPIPQHCPQSPGAGPDEYRRWMGCFMLERQNRVH
jgi:hypothetical protein